MFKEILQGRKRKNGRFHFAVGRKEGLPDKAGKEIGDLAAVLGKGLLAGLAGTMVMTVGQMAEMKMTGRKGSDVPAEGVTKVMPVDAPKSKEEKMKLAQLTHLAYGTAWGIPLGIMAKAGLSTAASAALHFAAVWGTALYMLPRLKLSPPVTEWNSKQIAGDILHHALYAAAAGLIYHAIRKR